MKHYILKRISGPVVSIALLFLFLIRCGSGNNHPAPPTQASLNLSVKVDVPTAGVTCESQFVFQFEPINLTGSVGRDATFSETRTIKSNPQLVGQDWICIYRTTVASLRVGTWRIRTQRGGWSTECVVELKAGANIANFALNYDGCVSSGTGYPGD